MNKKRGLGMVGLLTLLTSLVLIYPNQARTQERKLFIPDKALCAKMLRFGKEAYARGKYLDAKEYFRKAVQADPTSVVAWRYYDQAVIFALAQKVEKDPRFLLPDVTTKGQVTGPGPVSPSPTSEPKKPLEDEEEEGC